MRGWDGDSQRFIEGGRVTLRLPVGLCGLDALLPVGEREARSESGEWQTVAPKSELSKRGQIGILGPLVIL